MNELRVSLVQGETVWHDPAANRLKYSEWLSSLIGQTDLVVLPETFTSGFSNEALHNAETMQGETVAWMREQAKRLNAAITGSVQIRTEQGVFNRMIWATPEGDIQHYDKRHLFRMAREHERYAAGTDKLIVQYRGWSICPMVCYDLRFPVFIRNRFNQVRANELDYDLLIFVANWPAPRSLAWRTLLRARAIETLSYVAAVNRAGTDGNGLSYAGESAAIDFAGNVIFECNTEAQIQTVILNKQLMQEFREKFPAFLDADEFEIK
jgi:omega-amidase